MDLVRRGGMMFHDNETFIREGIWARMIMYLRASPPPFANSAPFPPILLRAPASPTLPHAASNHPSSYFVSVTELSPLTLHDDDDGYETTTATRPLRSCHPALAAALSTPFLRCSLHSCVCTHWRRTPRNRNYWTIVREKRFFNDERRDLTMTLARF